MKKIVCDASSIISISSSCLINSIKMLSQENGIEFIIPQSVEKESVTKPLHIKRFELNALRIKQGINEKWIKVIKTNKTVREETEKILELSNKIFWTENGSLKIIHKGEAEMYALAKDVGSSIVSIDERTARLLLESPTQLKKFIQTKQNMQISVNKTYFNELKKLLPNITIIRSTEIIALAFENNLLSNDIPKTKFTLEASLYAMKYSGCAISISEIEDYLRSVK